MENSGANQLYPIFLRMDKLRVLVVGAGEVGEEKLNFMLKSSPNAHITIVATWISDGVQKLLTNFAQSDVVIKLKEVEEHDLTDQDIIVAATCFEEVNKSVHSWAKKLGKIINVADTPDLCDFYMGSIVTKGDLKIAISTNGKSPTFSKRLRQYLEGILDDETTDLIDNLHKIRDKMDHDFKEKVIALNKITQKLLD